MTVAAEAEKKAAADRAEAVQGCRRGRRPEGEDRRRGCGAGREVPGRGPQRRLQRRSDGKARRQRSLQHPLGEQIAMQVRLALIQALPQIIAQSVKPLENIDGIKILHVEGLNGGGQRERRCRRQRSRRPGGFSGAPLPQPGPADRRADEGTRPAGRRSQRDDCGRAEPTRRERPNRRTDRAGKQSGQFLPPGKLVSPICSSSCGGCARHFSLALRSASRI